MALKPSDIDQIVDILHRFMPGDKLVLLITQLKAAKAYQSNKSFRETIDRIEGNYDGRFSRQDFFGRTK